MAQLRDAKTSALVFEGTPYAVAKMASQDPEAYIFDDVGPLFDPAAEIQRYEELEDALKVLKKAPKKNADQIESVEVTLGSLDPDSE